MATPSGFRAAVAHALSFLIVIPLLYWMHNQHPEFTVARRQSVPRLEFEAAAVYEYPEHLRPFLESLPSVPGVYLFHSESDTLPLYIGKSVNIRSRVLSHLRTPEEAAMLRQSRRISWIGTAGEIGALLLEARLIKEQQPLFNKRLRRNRQLCALTLRDGKVDVVYSRDVDFSHAPDLFGLFANRRAALAALQSLADEQKLCYGRLGLEPLSRGRACFRAALKRCAGVCCNKESPQEHDARLQASLEKLRVICWPWKNAIALKESRAQMTQYHVINNWLWLGAVDTLEDAATLIQTPAGFDHDGYKILCKPLVSGACEIIELNPGNVPAAR
ncbi:endonuclease of nucleotide excision repair [Citrobacter amalonaticus]|uniref:Excinuclease cho n=2 Tax=Enterobacteriaceae TaxID=543 RepID=A0AAX2BLC4_CITAM|nr:endonuclease of nucleotide excision repair [Citrobacter amalonaticus]SAZ90261.1 endonuclease of nucleotide excision repair [Citrobacter amalonaticus]